VSATVAEAEMSRANEMLAPEGSSMSLYEFESGRFQDAAYVPV
jgi:hypothetical protein